MLLVIQVLISVILSNILVLVFCPVFAKDITLYCPEAKNLTKQGIWWQAGNMWRSRSQSFSYHVNKFVGAQWVGVKVGKIICLYQGEKHLTFPVALETIHPLLVSAPTSPTWLTTQQGYKECTSDNVEDCPFIYQKPEGKIDIYEQIKYQAKPIDEE